jgi:hypothetical protein
LAVLAAPVALAAASACSGTTGSERFAFDARAGGIERAAGPYSFVNEKGWSVTLTRANVTLGPLYLDTVPPLSGQQGWLQRALLPVAHAAGESHLGEGRVVGEVLAQVSFDALSPQLVPFGARGTIVSEQVRTAAPCFYPPPGTAIETPKIDQVAVDLAGSAEKDGTTVAFRGALIFDDAWLPDPKPGSPGNQSMVSVRTVRGVPASFFPTSGGALELRMDVRRLFAGADFSSLDQSPEDPDGTKILVQSKTGKYTTDQVMRNVFAGTTATGTYAIRWVGQP